MKTKRRTVSAADFKAHCLRLMDEVASTKEILVVTKRGRAVVQIAPVVVSPPKSLRGSVRYHGDIESPIDVDWEADR